MTSLPGASITWIFCGSSRTSIMAFPASAGFASSSIGLIQSYLVAVSGIGLQHSGRIGTISSLSTARRAGPMTTARVSRHCIHWAPTPPPPLTLAQTCVSEKTIEITAIPDLLDEFAEIGRLEVALVTIDAMGRQIGIADKIVAHKADYLLALKGNAGNRCRGLFPHRPHRQTRH